MTSLKPGTELALSSRNRCVRSGSVCGGRRLVIVAAAEAYSDAARQRLLVNKVEETLMDGMTASAIAIKVIHCDSVRV